MEVFSLSRWVLQLRLGFRACSFQACCEPGTELTAIVSKEGVLRLFCDGAEYTIDMDTAAVKNCATLSWVLKEVTRLLSLEGREEKAIALYE